MIGISIANPALSVDNMLNHIIKFLQVLLCIILVEKLFKTLDIWLNWSKDIIVYKRQHLSIYINKNTNINQIKLYYKSDLNVLLRTFWKFCKKYIKYLEILKQDHAEFKNFEPSV